MPVPRRSEPWSSTAPPTPSGPLPGVCPVGASSPVPPPNMAIPPRRSSQAPGELTRGPGPGVVRDLEPGAVAPTPGVGQEVALVAIDPVTALQEDAVGRTVLRHQADESRARARFSDLLPAPPVPRPGVGQLLASDRTAEQHHPARLGVVGKAGALAWTGPDAVVTDQSRPSHSSVSSKASPAQSMPPWTTTTSRSGSRPIAAKLRAGGPAASSSSHAARPSATAPSVGRDRPRSRR